ncbi:MAG: hypothetical protein AAFS07_16805 [Pseudomonadota bacterium]
MVGSVVNHRSVTVEQYMAQRDGQRPEGQAQRHEGTDKLGNWHVSFEIRTGANLTRATTAWAGFKRTMTKIFDKPWTATLGKLSTTALARKEAREVRHAGYQLDRAINKLVGDVAAGRKEGPWFDDVLKGLQPHVDTLKRHGTADWAINERLKLNMQESLEALRAQSPRYAKAATAALQSMLFYRLRPEVTALDLEASTPKPFASPLRAAVLENGAAHRELTVKDLTELFGNALGSKDRQHWSKNLDEDQDWPVTLGDARRAATYFDRAQNMLRAIGITPAQLTTHNLILQKYPKASAAFDAHCRKECNFENIAIVRDLHFTMEMVAFGTIDTETLRQKVKEFVAAIDFSDPDYFGEDLDRDTDYPKGSVNIGDIPSQIFCEKVRNIVFLAENFESPGLEDFESAKLQEDEQEIKERFEVSDVYDEVGDMTDQQLKLILGYLSEIVPREVHTLLDTDAMARFRSLY